ncbi:hypothetical protein CL614_01745 [archaeon]|nr:hypothetical protein [archaeon]|tara:strand:+ start:2093 stop:2344 length:252 start_codon:yes stop_codon:yes gene_type:complete
MSETTTELTAEEIYITDWLRNRPATKTINRDDLVDRLNIYRRKPGSEFDESNQPETVVASLEERGKIRVRLKDFRQEYCMVTF